MEPTPANTFNVKQAVPFFGISDIDASLKSEG